MEVLVAGDARVVRVRASRRRARLAIVILANRPRLAAAAAGQEEEQHQLRRHDDCPTHQRCQRPPARAQERGGSAHSRSSAHGKHRRSCRKPPAASPPGASGRTGARRTISSRRAPASSRRRTPAPSPARSRPSLRHTNRQPGPQIRLNFLAGRRVCEAGVPLTSLSEGVEILGTFTAFSRSIAQCAPSSTTARTTHSELAAIRRDGKIL